MFQQYYSSICLHCEHIFTTAQQQPSCPTHHLEQTSNTPITGWIGQRHVTTMSWLFPIKAKCWDTPFELRNLAEAIIHHQEIRDLSYCKSQLAIRKIHPLWSWKSQPFIIISQRFIIIPTGSNKILTFNNISQTFIIKSRLFIYLERS